MDQPTTRESLVTTGVLLAIAAALWLALAAVLVLVVPGYEADFHNRAVRVPAATEWAIEAGRWAVKYWYVLPLFGLVVLPLVVLGSWLARHRAPSPWPARLWFTALIGLPVLLQLAVWSALLLP